MANPKTIENVLDKIPLPANGTERLKAFYEQRDELKTDTAVNLKQLKWKLELIESLDAKIVALIVHISWLDAARGTPAWSKLKPEEKHLFEEHTADEESHVHAHNDKRHGGRLSGGPDDEITTVRWEIDTMLKKGPLAGNPASARILREYSKKLNEPGLTPENLKLIRESLNKLQANMADFEVKDVQGIIDKINNYNESREEKNNEGNILFYGAVIHEMYRLKHRVLFGRGNTVTVAGGSGNSAERLQSTFAGKPTVIEWLKRGMVTSTSHWTDYMNSYPSKSTATVEKYISTFREGTFDGGSIDADFLASSRNGGFDIKWPDGKWITRGMNIHSIAQAAQEAAKKWKEMGYQTPMQKAGGRTVQFAEMAYNVAKFGFAAASVWKGTKALWKTIFWDEASMKAAWWDFGKTLAWTGAVWYGGEGVKTLANDIKSDLDLPNYVEWLQTLSADPEKSGMLDGFEAIWDKIGGGYMPGMVKTSGLLETFMPSTVPAHQFKEMWETLCTGRRSNWFLNMRIQDLSNALDNSYHVDEKTGSHVGGVREFLMGMEGGKEIYDKFFINPKTRDNGMKFLRAIADYRSDDSEKPSVDRKEKISALFATTLTKKTEVPANLNPEMDAMYEAFRSAGYETAKLLPEAAGLWAHVWEVIVGGGRHLIKITDEALLDPKNKEILSAAVAIVGTVALWAGAIWWLSLVPGTGLVLGSIKWLTWAAILGWSGYMGYKLIDTVSKKMKEVTSADGLLKLILSEKDYNTLKAMGIIDSEESKWWTIPDIMERIKKAVAASSLPDSIKDILESVDTNRPDERRAPSDAPHPPIKPKWNPDDLPHNL